MDVFIDNPRFGRRRYRVSWQHKRRQPDWPKKKKESTTCLIREVNLETGEDIEHGYKLTGAAKCSLKDQYCRETGRMRSMKAAMADFAREVRELFWSAYNGQIGIKALRESKEQEPAAV